MTATATWELERGESIELLRARADASVDLIYMDPPFCTGRVLRGRTEADAFNDRWPDRAAYLDFMRGHLVEAHRLLKPTGNLLLHCDSRTCHHLWIELEQIFGADRAVNHLVWSYGLGGSSPRSFARKHDDILFFARGEDYWFEAPRVPSRSLRMAGASKKATDVLDVPSLNNMALERNGWPSQKPLELLTMLVGACCPVGGVVLDPFCGSGTTLEAALALGRHAIGFDRSERALELAARRLQKASDRRGAEDAAAGTNYDADTRAKCDSSARNRSRAAAAVGRTEVK